MIGHHAPSVQAVPRAIEMQQGILDDLGQARIPQEAAAVAAIEKVLDAPAPFAVSFFLRPRPELLTPARQHRLRQRIEEVETNMLRYPFAIEMWEVTA